jgi:hypothetical protein
MDTKSASILGVCIIIAATIVSLKPSNETGPKQTQEIVQQTTGRFQISNPGEKGIAFVIDTETGRVWRAPVGMSGGTDGARFYNQKLNDKSMVLDAK